MPSQAILRRSRPVQKPLARALGLSVLALATLLSFGCSKGDTGPVKGGSSAGAVTVASGESLFNRNCSRCHGPKASGSKMGPPLVHKVYEPSHHADAAFYRAVQGGVKAHHWRFGNMPRIGGVSNEEIGAIVGYIRGLQREAGIF